MARFEVPRLEARVPAAAGATADSLYELGLMYAAGREVGVDLVAAHKWLNIAAFRGNVDARRMRSEIAAEMTREEIMEAQKQARAWVTMH